jgi:predicted nucleotidyltransferase
VSSTSDLEQIRSRADELSLEFLLIGGLAVIEHGFARLTADVDLLIRKRSEEQWRDMLKDLGYHPIQQKQNFAQYEPPEPAMWPVDLMLVNDSTFDGLASDSSAVEVMGAHVRMVSLKHLLALKLHVLKQGKLHRFLDDFNDVVELVRANHLDLQSSDFRDLFLRYGSADLYDKVLRISQAK